MLMFAVLVPLHKKDPKAGWYCCVIYLSLFCSLLNISWVAVNYCVKVH